jgi:hypothetical protein
MQAARWWSAEAVLEMQLLSPTGASARARTPGRPAAGPPWTHAGFAGGGHFKYSDFAPSPAFQQTSSPGGPSREGLDVSIHYVGIPEKAEILRLAVRK